MPWQPTAQEQTSLKVQTTQKWRDVILTSKQVDECVASLKRAKNKKQAEAVLVAVSNVAELNGLSQTW
jgi:hypothetical protein